MSPHLRERERLPVLGEALLHPGALAALAVLVVNDHALKRLWPSFVTGKLSDLAGMVFFPLLLYALLELALAPFGVRLARVRPRWRRLAAAVCVGSSALGFAAVKTLPFAAEAFRRSLGALHCLPSVLSGAAPAACRVNLVRDPTDLLALPCVLVAWWMLGRAQLKSRPASRPSSAPSTNSLAG